MLVGTGAVNVGIIVGVLVRRESSESGSSLVAERRQAVETNRTITINHPNHLFDWPMRITPFQTGRLSHNLIILWLMVSGN